ncbi:MAG TPA: hypothetical protein EYH31_11805 [Anaerolineae bacterium]|nr:hypothetical protein [Anaerolineae bacterium]
MKRTDQYFSTVFICLPYTLLLLFLLLQASTALLPGTVAVVAWWVLRWLLRAGFVGGAYLGWRQGKPIWFFPWLGFAVYEAVATLLGGTIWLAERLASSVAVMVLVVLPLLAIAFAPYLIAALWSARHDRLLAVYTVFPHAALTVPLFVLVRYRMFGQPADWLLKASLVPLLIAMEAAAVFPCVTRHRRWALLYAAMVLAQVIFSLSASVFSGGPWIEALFLGIPLGMLGGLILSGPLILLVLAQGGQRLLTTATGGAWLRER